MTRNRIIILASVVLIFTTTLFPFNFTLRGSVLSWNALALPPGKDGKWKFLVNILLYFPLGFGITAYFCSRRLQIRRALTLVLVICFAISYFCEVLQFFLPSKVSLGEISHRTRWQVFWVRSVCLSGRKFDELSLQLFGSSLHSSFRSGSESSQLVCCSF